MFLKENFLNHYKTAIFIIMAILTIVFIGKIADIAIMFFGAFIISASVIPVVNKLKNYMPKGLAVSLVLFLILFLILLIFVPLTMLAVKQFSLLLDNLPQKIEQLKTFLAFKIGSYSVSDFLNLSDIQNATSDVGAVVGNIVNGGVTAGKAIANSITSILMVTIMVFYLCADEQHFKAAYLTFFPPKFKKKAGEILDILMTKVGGYVSAQILAMAGVGLFTLIGLLIIRHPHGILIGFLTFILDIIPVFGATAAVITGAVTAWDMGIGYVFLTLGVMLAAQWAQNQLLRPYLFGKFMNIHPLLIIVSLLIGAKFLGITGVVLGPAFASLVCVLVNELYVKQINSDGK